MSQPVPDAIAAAGPVVEILEALGVPYHVGGSLASSAHGMPRASVDVDLVVELRPEQVDTFVRQLGDDYYVSLERAREAVRLRRSFNVIHLATMMKVDLFIAEGRPFAEREQARARPELFGTGGATRAFMVKSPEDLVLRKLIWFKDGGQASERQWSDVVGLLKLRAGRFDGRYLETWSVELGVSDLLQKALADAT